MNSDIIEGLDADAGWIAAGLSQEETKEVTKQRDSQSRWASIRQPKLDAFNRISVIVSSDGPAEEKLDKIKDAITEANRKSLKREADTR